ncbi:MAG: hypothetical protein KAS75_03355 [Planctomycetes bacterium]|nr:hypothetical protein [Planctomycetota bacterium]
MWIAIVISIVFVVIILAKRMNNYDLIARNTTFIYEILKHDFKDYFSDEDSFLATSAVIDALIYIQKNQLTIDDIKRGVRCAKIGECHLSLGYQISLYDNVVEYCIGDEQNDFLCFILQLEALIFNADSNMSPELILNAVKSKKHSIKKTIESTQKKYKSSGASQTRKKQVYGFMTHGSFAGLREKLGVIEPINTMSPAQIVQSIPTVWFRVPLCIYIGYYDNKATEDSVIDHEALAFAMKGTDAQVYGRELETVHEEASFKLAAELFLGMKDGTEKEKLEDAIFSLLLGELINGGTNISSKLAAKSADLGFVQISKPIIGKLLAAGHPPSETIISEISEEGMKKAMSMEC